MDKGRVAPKKETRPCKVGISHFDQQERLEVKRVRQGKANSNKKSILAVETKRTTLSYRC